jgi:DNA-binding transcriptional ArsR family regulator
MTHDPSAAPSPAPEDLKRFAQAVGLLALPVRLQIVLTLASGERDVMSLCRAVKQRQPPVSHHLGILRAAGLVANRRDSRQIFYRLREPICAALPECAGVALDAGGYRLRFTVGTARRGES